MSGRDQTYAKVIADSISPDGVRLTTMEFGMWRSMLPEFNTHRTFSRNSASSRAIPFARQIAKIEHDLFTPVVWAAEQKGMQGGEEITSPGSAEWVWKQAAEDSVKHAKSLVNLGVHKSIVNRLIEPFMQHKVVVTATAWQNFFNQRCSPLAQPEIRLAAECIREAMMASKPQQLHEGEWHLPYIGDDPEALDTLAGQVDHPAPWDSAAMASAARCARVSYETQDGKRDAHEDLRLYQRLISAQPEPHWSPLEHVATPWRINRQRGGIVVPLLDGTVRQLSVTHLPRVGNLLAWRSLRTTVEAEMCQVTYR